MHKQLEGSHLPGANDLESGIPDLRASLAAAASGRPEWANLPMSGTMSPLTNPAGTTENAALISAKALQAIRFQTKQSGSMNQNFFRSVLLTDEFPKGRKVTLLLSRCLGFFLPFPFKSCCLQPIYTILY